MWFSYSKSYSYHMVINWYQSVTPGNDSNFGSPKYQWWRWSPSCLPTSCSRCFSHTFTVYCKPNVISIQENESKFIVKVKSPSPSYLILSFIMCMRWRHLCLSFSLQPLWRLHPRGWIQACVDAHVSVCACVTSAPPPREFVSVNVWGAWPWGDMGKKYRLKERKSQGGLQRWQRTKQISQGGRGKLNEDREEERWEKGRIEGRNSFPVKPTFKQLAIKNTAAHLHWTCDC